MVLVPVHSIGRLVRDVVDPGVLVARTDKERVLSGTVRPEQLTIPKIGRAQIVAGGALRQSLRYHPHTA